jgi:hypothetical protein
MIGRPNHNRKDVLGMIVIGFPETGTTAIKAGYIMEVIEENRLND